MDWHRVADYSMLIQDIPPTAMILPNPNAGDGDDCHFFHIVYLIHARHVIADEARLLVKEPCNDIVFVKIIKVLPAD
jgi:hypothetical protein